MSHISDPNYDAVWPGDYGHFQQDIYCKCCGGIKDGLVGFPGEWSCECGCSDEYDDTIDVEQAQLKKKESE